jgi:hypothetical protein
MTLAKPVQLTAEEETERDTFLFDYHAERSKITGDWHFRQAEQISGDGDYIRGQDDGEPPKGAEWN